MRTTSFSQNIMFDRYPRLWYYQYIAKIPAVQDFTYANAGSVLHKSLQKYYDNKLSIEQTKHEFEKEWQKYNLDDTILKHKKSSYWLMVVNGVNLNITLTSNEFKVFYPDVVGYIDGINTTTDEIVDWKSSTRREENEEEYLIQLKFYAYLYQRKFNRLPKKCTVHYLKYTGTKGLLEYIPTNDDIKNIERWHFDIRQKMEELIQTKKLPECGECSPFCPYKNMCHSKEGELFIQLNLKGNYIFVDGNISPLLDMGIKKKFSYELKNAYFIKQAKPHADTTVCFWNEKRKMLPIAFKAGLLKTLKDYCEHKKINLNLKINDMRMFNDEKIEMPDKFINNVVLRDYQEDAVREFMRKKIGIMEIATGGGKTEIAIELIRKLNMKTLFIVDKIELLKQTKKRIENALGIKVGTIVGGEEDIEFITVATVQSLTKRLHIYNKYLNSIRFCIFDETHKVAARSYWKIGNKLTSSEYRLGMSGSAFRDDGNDMMINGIVGYKCYSINAEKLINDGWLIKPKIIFIKDYMEQNQLRAIELNCKDGLINETEQYNEYYKNYIDNDYRNMIVGRLIQKHLDKKILILTKLVEHGKKLSIMLECEHLHGSVKKDERKKMFDKFDKGENKIIVSTLSIFSEGIDIPDLDIVINAGANKGNVKSIQVLGRVLRKITGKQYAIYYDFIDEHRFFRSASNARKRALKREGHDIVVESLHLNNG